MPALEKKMHTNTNAGRKHDMQLDTEQGWEANLVLIYRDSEKSN